MKTTNTLQRIAFLALAIAFVDGHLAQAQEKHRRTFVSNGAPAASSRQEISAKASTKNLATPALNLYSIQASFTDDYPVIGANSDGSNLWPCLQHYHGGDGSNVNCPTLGNPSLPSPKIGVVLGKPGYSWPLQNSAGRGNGFGCDALTNGTTGVLPSQYTPCGLVATWFEDATGDSTDDLIYRIVVRQGSSVIYDSGIVNFGPAGPTVTYPVDVILTSDSNFGYWPGASLGPNNGNCSPAISYPLSAPANPGFYVTASNKTCAEPVSGQASVNTWTALGTPEYTKVAGSACTSQGVASPCYTVEWDKKYQIKQDWTIFLE